MTTRIDWPPLPLSNAIPITLPFVASHTKAALVLSSSRMSGKPIILVPESIDNEAPKTPTNLTTSTTLVPATVTLNWNASIDNVAVTGYKIYRNGTLLQDVGNVLTYIDNTVSLGILYTYIVTAYDAAGNESSGATISISLGKSIF